MTFHFGIIAAFITAVGNETVEIITKVENSFHTEEVFKRDRILALLVFLYTAVIVKLHLLFATLVAPISLLALTSYIDQGKPRVKATRRNFIKPVVDIAATTLGPAVCLIILGFIK